MSAAPMRVGVNALYLIPGGVGGTEIYLRQLLDALAAVDPDNQYVLYTNRETGRALGPAAPNFVVREMPVRAARRPARILFEQFRLPLRRDRIGVLLNPGFTTPLAAPCPAVTVFHDLQHVRHPEHFRWFDLPAWRFLLWAAARRSERLIAVSHATAADIRAHYGREAAVVHHGVDPRFLAMERRAPGRFLLCVSTLHPHKNLARLVEAFHAFRERHPDFRLVIPGLRGFFTAQLEAKIAALGLGGAVELKGWIPREELLRLYETAWAFVYPSTFEGFGMPVLEAMAAGLPVVCSAIPPLEEVAGGAAELFPPGDTAALAAALTRITDDEALRRRLAAAGRERAREFTWERCARATLAELRAAYRSRSSS
jgi:glycosyltransferase involved in cell wall biosynthesis